MDIRSPNSSAVVVQRVPPTSANWFLDWQRKVSEESSKFDGFVSDEVFPPPPESDIWVAIVHFQSPEQLKAWLDAPVRATLVADLREKVGDFEVSGFGPWFVPLTKGDEMPPAWKMVLTVVLGLYPIVMLWSKLAGQKAIDKMGFESAMLFSNFLSCCLLQWIMVPILMWLLRPWLNPRARLGVTVAGVVLILLALVGMDRCFSRF